MTDETVIAADDFTLTSSMAEYTLELTKAQVASITDWSDLMIRFGIDAAQMVYVSWAQFEVPDATGNTGPGLEMGMAA